MGIRTPFDNLGTTGNSSVLPFVFTINTTKNTANSSDKTFIVPFVAGTYSSLAGSRVGILWGDGTSTIINDGIFTQANCTHTYTTAGQYTISIVSDTGKAPKFNFEITYPSVNNNSLKLISLDSSIIPPVDTSGNDILIETFYWAFCHCKNLERINADLFKNCPDITEKAFRSCFGDCPKLTSIPATLFRYNTAVSFEAFRGTFGFCTGLTSIPATLFRYNLSAGDAAFRETFAGCTNLTTIPETLFAYAINVGEDAFYQTFRDCTNLTTIPTNLLALTNGTGFQGMFKDCTRLTVNPYIFGDYNSNPSLKTTKFNKNKTYNFTEMFNRTSFIGTPGTEGTAGDFWTWTYQNPPIGNQCYGGDGNINLTNYEDIPPVWGGPAWYRVTINATPSNASISLTATGYTQVDNYIEVRTGTLVTWTVSSPHYIEQSNSLTVTEDTTLNITLDPILYTFTINPTPSDATVKFTVGSTETIANSISVPINTEVEWEVSKNHYITRNGTKTVTEDSSLTVPLTPETYTITINATPADSIVKINGEVRTTAQFTYNTLVNYEVHRAGYNKVVDQFFIDQDTTLNITLVETTYTVTIIPTPSDAVVTINGQVRTTATLPSETEVTFTITKEGYLPYDDTFILEADTVRPVELEVAYRLTINATPANSTITLTAEGAQQVDNYIDTNYGDTIQWSVECEDYVTQSGSYVITEDTTWNIVLAVQTYRFTIQPTPVNATVTLTVNGTTYTQNYIDVEKNTTIQWSVTKPGYDPESGTQFIAKADVTLPVHLTGNTYVDVEDYTYIETPSGVTITKYIGSGTVLEAPHLEAE